MAKAINYDTQLLVKIPSKDLEALKKYASDKNTTVSDLIRSIYTRKLKREKYL